MAAAEAIAAAVSPMSSTTIRSCGLAVSATTSAMSRTSTPSSGCSPAGTKGPDWPVGHPAASRGRPPRGEEGAGRAGGATDGRLPRSRGAKPRGKQRRRKEAGDAHADGENGHERGRDDDDVAEAAQPDVLPEPRRTRP